MTCGRLAPSAVGKKVLNPRLGSHVKLPETVAWPHVSLSTQLLCNRISL